MRRVVIASSYIEPPKWDKTKTLKKVARTKAEGIVKKQYPEAVGKKDTNDGSEGTTYFYVGKKIVAGYIYSYRELRFV